MLLLRFRIIVALFEFLNLFIGKIEIKIRGFVILSCAFTRCDPGTFESRDGDPT